MECLFYPFFDKKAEGILQAKDAFFDALKKDFSRNEMMLEKYKNFKLEPTNYFLKKLSLLEFLESFKKYRLIGPLNRTIIAKNFGRSLSFFVTGKYNGPTRVLAFFGKKILFIEEIDFVKERVWFFECENNRLISIPLSLLSGFLALIFTLIFVPILMLKLKNESKEN